MQGSVDLLLWLLWPRLLTRLALLSATRLVPKHSCRGRHSQRPFETGLDYLLQQCCQARQSRGVPPYTRHTGCRHSSTYGVPALIYGTHLRGAAPSIRAKRDGAGRRAGAAARPAPCARTGSTCAHCPARPVRAQENVLRWDRENRGAPRAAAMEHSRDALLGACNHAADAASTPSFPT